jgi:hypothetical protein
MTNSSYELCCLHSVVPEAEQLLDLLILLALLLTAHSLTAHPLIAPLLEFKVSSCGFVTFWHGSGSAPILQIRNFLTRVRISATIAAP